MSSIPILSIPFLLIASTLFFPTEAVSFTCDATTTATCQGLVGYNATNSTTYGAIQSLFQVDSLLSLLGANDLPLSTPSSHPVQAGSTVRIPFPCTCSNGTGVSNRNPIYTVKPTDPGLDSIARYTFEQFVTYQEIAVVNNITNVNVINKGEKLWIPLPCSCDPVGGEDVVHLGHVVAAGSSLEGIAAEFGTPTETLLLLNGISDPKSLLAGQVLDVPLKACSSSISSTSLDHNLRLPNGSYALTAENCIQCSCSSSSKYQLSCHYIQGLNSSACPLAKCAGDLSIGNTTSSGCDLTTCAYAGYTNSTGFNIHTNLTTQSSCNNGSEPAPQPGGSLQPGSNSQPSGSSASRLGLQGYWIELLVFLHTALLWCSFLG